MHYSVHVDRLEMQSKRPCSTEMDDKLDDCIYAQAAHTLMSHFNCVLPFLPPTQDNKLLPICQQGNTDPLLFFKHAFWYHQEHLCRVPCKKMTVAFGVNEREEASQGIYKNRAQVRIYMKSIVQYTETRLDYSMANMMAGRSYTRTNLDES